MRVACVTLCRRSFPCVTMHHVVSRGDTRCRAVSPGIAGCRQVLPGVARCCRVSPVRCRSARGVSLIDLRVGGRAPPQLRLGAVASDRDPAGAPCWPDWRYSGDTATSVSATSAVMNCTLWFHIRLLYGAHFRLLTIIKTRYESYNVGVLY